MESAILERHVATYLRAKDENRPHRLADAFSPRVQLQMEVKASAIRFPAAAEGLEEVARILSRDFARTYENVYTFCLGRLPEATSTLQFDCPWLVVMTTKEGGELRVGWGWYQWNFEDRAPFLVTGLRIRIEAMEVLPPRAHRAIYAWASGLPYPWCTPADAIADWPDEPLLAAMRQQMATACSQA